MAPQFKIDHIVDAVISGTDARYDDATVFIDRELRAVRKKVYEVQYTELLGMSRVPPDSEPTDPGAVDFTYTYEDRVGKATLGASMATNPPRVDVSRVEVAPIKVRHIDVAYGWTIAELRSAMFANRPLAMARADAARKAVATLHDDIILLGDGTGTYLGLRGLYNLLSVLTVTLANGGQSGTKVWEGKNGREIVADMNAVVDKATTNSNGIEVPDTLDLPLTSFMVAANTPWGVDSQVSALDYFLNQRRKLNPGFQVLASPKLETAGSGSTKRMIAYKRSSEKVARVDPIEFEQQPPQLVGNQTIINCHAQTAGVYTPFPSSITTADGL
jgi:hypothetical protein